MRALDSAVFNSLSRELTLFLVVTPGDCANVTQFETSAFMPNGASSRVTLHCISLDFKSFSYRVSLYSRHITG